jgi:predicted phage terminase large subunit-like protein
MSRIDQELLDNAPTLAAIRAERSRRFVEQAREVVVKAGKLDLPTFIKLAWHVVEPARPYVPSWHIDCVSDHLEAVSSGQLIRLLINMPPGMMKSLLSSVFWMAWEWGPHGTPSHRFISFSYDTALSTRDSLRCRRLIQSPWYQSLWGDRFQLADDQSAKTRYENDQTGFRIADYVGGGTGDRGDRDIVDDPHNVKDGESDTKRNTALLWLAETLPTRMNDPEKSAIVIIHHRIHSEDLGGEVLSKGLGYEHLMLPMEFEPKRCSYTKVKPSKFVSPEPVSMRRLANEQIWLPNDWKPITSQDQQLVGAFSQSKSEMVYRQDPRHEEDELIFPGRFPRDVVERDKRAMGAYAVAGQFQQRPAPRGGGMIKRHWFELVDAVPQDCRWVRRWDLASTAGAGAYTAGVLMGRSKINGLFYIRNIVREQLDGDGVKRLISQTSAIDMMALGKRNYSVWLPQDPGQAGKVQAKDFVMLLAGYDAHSEIESGDKETRARPFAAQAEAGNVKLLNGPWVEAFLAECSTFPTGRFKDQVDAASGAFGVLIMHQKRSMVVGATGGAY